MPLGNRKHAILLAVLLLAVFACTLAYAFGFRIKPMVDARWYDTIAWNIASGKGFKLVESNTLSEDPAIACVGPGFEYFLAGIYGIFGHHLEPVWIIQSVLHMLNALIVFLLARWVLPNSAKRFRFALLGAALYGLNPDLIQIAAMLLTETLFLTLLLLATLGMLAFAARPSTKTVVATAIALALAILVRPIAIIPLAIFLILLVVKKKPAWLLVALLIQTVFIGPWTLRNYSVYGRFVPITAAGGYDLWVGNNPGANGEPHPTQEITDYVNTYGILEADGHGVGQVLNFLSEDPASFVKLQLIKTAKFFSIIRTSAWWFHLSGVARALTFFLSGGFFIVLLLLGIPGIYFSLRDGPALARILALLALAVPLAVIPIVVTSRFRYPMYPFLAVLGALTAYRYREGELSRRPFLISAGLIIVATLIDIFISAPQIPDRIMRLFF